MSMEQVENTVNSTDSEAAVQMDPPEFWDTILCDIEWSGGPIDVVDDHDPNGWKAKGLEKARLIHCLYNLGFAATFMYRLSKWCHEHNMKAPATLIQNISLRVTGANISPKANIAPGLRIGHPQGVFIGPDVKVGIRSTFNQGTCVTADQRMQDENPQVGNYLYMSPGSKVFGPVKVGDRVWVGPNSVVMKDIESDKVVLGVPGRAMSPEFRNKAS